MRPGVRVTAAGLVKRHPDGTVALDGVDLTIEPGRLTAVIGPSGAGKTTLLAALGGVTGAPAGSVWFDGPGADGEDTRVAFVPQEDILHGELPLRRTLRYAAKLRMKESPYAVDAAVDAALAMLGLSGQADVPVHALSGGQRKRASIACEILTDPPVIFLDEPTSGLDPSASADLVSYLRRLAAAGSTVVFTTHSIQDVERSDVVVALAPGGRVVAGGSPAEVLARLGADDFSELYARLAGGEVVAPAPMVVPEAAPSASLSRSRRGGSDDGPGAFRQWLVLTRRAAEIVTRSRLTLAILVGSPAAVIAMFAVLFRPGAFDPAAADTTAAIQATYWLSFAGFFFGLTFGLLQVCTELPVVRRERHAGVRTSAYVASKMALLTPVLLVIDVVMVEVLQALGRIPHLSAGALVQLHVTMGLNAAAALCLGLLASASVNSAAQAALALPMLCFPAVLFSGAMVPLPVMASAGRGIAAVMSDRWAFEGIARHLHVGASAGPASPYGGLGASSAATYWMLLAAFIVVTAAAAYAVVHRRARPAR